VMKVLSVYYCLLGFISGRRNPAFIKSAWSKVPIYRHTLEDHVLFLLQGDLPRYRSEYISSNLWQ